MWTWIYIIAILLIVHYVNDYIQMRGTPPGPFRFPIIGNVHLLDPEKPFITFHQLALKYGGIYQLQLGDKRTVLLNSPEILKEAYIKKGALFSNRSHDYDSVKRFSDNFNDVALSNGRVWREARKLMHQAIVNNLKIFNEKIDSETIEAIKIIRGYADRDEAFDIEKVVTLLAFNVMYMAATGLPRVKKLEDLEYAKILGDVNAAVTAADPRDFFKFLRFFPINKKKDEDMEKLMDVRDAAMNEMIRKQKEGLDPENPRGFLDTIIANASSNRLARNVLFDFFAAGVDTTVLSTAWVVSIVTGYPEVQKRSHDETDVIIGRDRIIRHADLERIPYTQAVHKEGTRYRLPAPMAMPRKLDKETTLGGYRIPAGYEVIMNYHHLSNDPKTWKNPELFRPERFLEEDADLELLGPHDFQNMNNAKFIPLGMGRRCCSGYPLAVYFSQLIVANLMHHFDWYAPGGQEVNLDQILEGVGRPKHDLIVKAKYRFD